MVTLPIKEPGVYSGISLADYHSANICDGPCVSSTGLRKLWNGAPSDFWANWESNPNRIAHVETAPQKLGTAAHHLLLGEDAFSTRYIQRPEELEDSKTGELKEWNGNRTDCKRWLAEQTKANKIVLKQSEIECIRAMADSIQKHPFAKDLLLGDVERSMVAKDPETGLWLRARPDVVPLDGDYADLKTVAEGSQISAIGAITSYSYHQQAALVWEVAELLGRPFESFSFIFVGTATPHNVFRVTLSDEAISIGRRQNRAMLRVIANCIEAESWPGPDDIEFFKLASPRIEFIEKRLQYLEAERHQHQHGS